MPALKLEVGKKYKNRHGEIIKIIDKTNLLSFEGIDSFGFTREYFMTGGKHTIFDSEDLITEHTEEPMNEIDNDLTPCCNAYWNVGNICSKCNKMVSNNAEEIRLEVGKKYDIDH